MFASAARDLARAEPVRKGRKNPGRDREVVELSGLEEVAVLEAAIAALTALKDAAKGRVTTAMVDRFVEEGMKAGDRPDNFIGAEGGATASCELRLRASNSPIPAADVMTLAAAGLAAPETTVSEPGLRINPAYLGNAGLLARIDAALKGVEGLPADFVEPVPAVVHTIATPELLAAAFALELPAEQVKRLVPILGVPALRPKLAGDVDWSRVVDLITAPAKEPQA